MEKTDNVSTAMIEIEYLKPEELRVELMQLNVKLQDYYYFLRRNGGNCNYLSRERYSDADSAQGKNYGKLEPLRDYIASCKSRINLDPDHRNYLSLDDIKNNPSSRSSCNHYLFRIQYHQNDIMRVYDRNCAAAVDRTMDYIESDINNAHQRCSICELD